MATEAQAIDKAATPATIASLSDDLRRLGLEEGATVLVHCSLSALGWVVGGSVAVVESLEAALGPQGTLVMPAHSSGLSDPSGWGNPSIPEAWWTTVRDALPPFDPAMTPTRGMGAVAETFRGQPGTRRSAHPQVSFVARGPRAHEVTAEHGYADQLGDQSPLGRLYDLDAHVLLLGVDHASNTSLHLAEYRVEPPVRRPTRNAVPIGRTGDGTTEWGVFDDVHLDADDFPIIGEQFAREATSVRTGPVGAGQAQLMRQRELVDFAVLWLQRHRPAA